MDEEERKERQRENLEILAQLRLLDDEFMTVVYQDDLECTNLTLRIILNDPNITATKVITQHTLTNLQKKSVRLDIHAFSLGKEYDVEIQRASKGAAPRRARYNSSMMDANTLLSGEEYESLPENVVIFMTETDVLKKGRPIYVIHRRIDGTGELFDDGTTIVYVNCANKDESTPLGKLVHDFRCNSADEMYYPELAKRVRYFKEKPEGVAQMSDVLEKFAEKTAERNTLHSIRALMETLNVTAEKAMELLKIDKTLWKKYLALL